ncbi:GAF domain-containing sensor histidine kinase [Oligoflexia bacterium]|nr:GAF domain-containing sensor histidine kinase [Oligoflexia bacterium]
MNDSHQKNDQLASYVEAVLQIAAGNSELNLPDSVSDHEQDLCAAIRELYLQITAERVKTEKLTSISRSVNSGMLLEEILEVAYDTFHDVIPYNRLGFSVLEDQGRSLLSVWAKSDMDEVHLSAGYCADLQGSSLQGIIDSGQPRIIDDLVAYLEQKPDSESTALIVKEGLRSSLTCPLIADDKPIGFIFFSSTELNAYKNIHADLFLDLTSQLAIVLEKGRLVSEMKTQKEAIEEQNKELLRLSALRNNFLGMAAHDLRGPIAQISLIGEMLLESSDALSKEKEEQLFGMVYRQSRHMMKLIDDLLDVTKIEAGQLELKPQQIQISSFLKQIMRDHIVLAAPKNITVTLQEVSGDTIYADPDRLRQILDNLISNAVKYSPAASSILVRANQDSSQWRFEVQDEGPGLTEEDRKHLFQDFKKLSAQPTGGEKSVGLGLAIARRVVVAHGGTIGVDSHASAGATFWFELPIR